MDDNRVPRKSVEDYQDDFKRRQAIRAAVRQGG